MPAPLLTLPNVDDLPPIEIPQLRNGLWNGAKGFGAGLADTLIGVKDGVVELFKGAWKGFRDYSPVVVLWRLGTEGRYFTIEDRRRMDSAWKTAESLWPVVHKVMQDQDAFVQAALTGDLAEVNRLGEEYKIVLEFAAEALHALHESISDMDDYDYWRVSGRIVGETMLAVVTAGAGSAALKSATMGSVVARLKGVSGVSEGVAYVVKYPKLNRGARMSNT